MLRLLEQAETLCLKLCGKNSHKAAVLLVKAQRRYDRRLNKAISDCLSV